MSESGPNHLLIVNELYAEVGPYSSEKQELKAYEQEH